MKILTMIMRSPNSHRDTKNAQYVLIDQEYAVVKMSASSIADEIKAGKIAVTNMGLNKKGEVVSTNGTLERYTVLHFESNTIYGRLYPVVLNRAELNGKLVGYTIFNTSGVIQEISTEEALKLHTVVPFSNGRLSAANRNTIASISGEYPLRSIEISKVSNKAFEVELVYIGSAVGKNNKVSKHAGIIVTCDNAATLSKFNTKLKDENAKVIKGLNSIGADDEYNSAVKNVRVGANGIYCVCSFSSALELMQKASKVTNKVGKVVIACYDLERKEESSIVVNKDLKLIEINEGSNIGDGVLKVYVEEVIRGLKTIKFSD